MTLPCGERSWSAILLDEHRETGSAIKATEVDRVSLEITAHDKDLCRATDIRGDGDVDHHRVWRLCRSDVSSLQSKSLSTGVLGSVHCVGACGDPCHLYHGCGQWLPRQPRGHAGARDLSRVLLAKGGSVLRCPSNRRVCWCGDCVCALLSGDRQLQCRQTSDAGVGRSCGSLLYSSGPWRSPRCTPLATRLF